ncbi:winged helix-turn-helix domain-containing protein [Streptomyces sp. TRM49041]|uniref:winged helix-turn-helix domain-containing protein n=1 Tax=Streptomyces sp. TRM49041 TaxID=2603216 RepID=UPI0037DA302C
MGAFGAELKRGPLAHDWDDEFQGWTLKRVKSLIGRMFHIWYTLQGVWKLLPQARQVRVGAVAAGAGTARRRSRCGRRRCGRG